MAEHSMSCPLMERIERVPKELLGCNWEYLQRGA